MAKKPYSIGVWGPATAGKTWYLIALHSKINEPLEKIKEQGWKLEPKGENTEKFLDLVKKALAKKNIPQSQQEEKYEFEVRGYGSWWLGELQADMIFNDIPGQLLPTASQKAYDILRQCNGILCCIDPKVDEMLFVKPSSSNPEVREQLYENQEGFYRAQLLELFQNLRMKKGDTNPFS